MERSRFRSSEKDLDVKTNSVEAMPEYMDIQKESGIDMSLPPPNATGPLVCKSDAPAHMD